LEVILEQKQEYLTILSETVSESNQDTKKQMKVEELLWMGGRMAKGFQTKPSRRPLKTRKKSDKFVVRELWR